MSISSLNAIAVSQFGTPSSLTLSVSSLLLTYTPTWKETLEYLKSFKNTMVSTLPNEKDITKPFIYHEYFPFFKPTLDAAVEDDWSEIT
ncbi:hypothetical protein AB4K20DRAFT_1958881 [Rhizopus microsporus]